MKLEKSSDGIVAANIKSFLIIITSTVDKVWKPPYGSSGATSKKHSFPFQSSERGSYRVPLIQLVPNISSKPK